MATQPCGPKTPRNRVVDGTFLSALLLPVSVTFSGHSASLGLSSLSGSVWCAPLLVLKPHDLRVLSPLLYSFAMEQAAGWVLKVKPKMVATLPGCRSTWSTVYPPPPEASKDLLLENHHRNSCRLLTVYCLVGIILRGSHRLTYFII